MSPLAWGKKWKNLSIRKQTCLFVCFVLFVGLRSSGPKCPPCVLDMVGKPLMSKGARRWFHGLRCKRCRILNNFVIENLIKSKLLKK